MRKNSILVVLIAAGMLVGQSALAVPDFAAMTLETPGVIQTLNLPAHADHAPVISLGTAVDPVSGKAVEGYAIIHYRGGEFTHRDGEAKGGGGGKGGGETCFGFLARDAKWKTVEPWVVNAANTSGLGDAFIKDTLAGGVMKWEDAADGTVGDGGSINIIGNGSLTSTTLEADTASPDGVNEVYFGNPGSSAIAVTIVWGIFGGPPSGRELVEWDQIYNEVTYDWSASGEANKMDFDNIATHELGHSFGMDDLYTASCASETMYGFADFGETNKRTLEKGDIAGISKLY